MSDDREEPPVAVEVEGTKNVAGRIFRLNLVARCYQTEVLLDSLVDLLQNGGKLTITTPRRTFTYTKAAEQEATSETEASDGE